jgi:hypothetical protein
MNKTQNTSQVAAKTPVQKAQKSTTRKARPRKGKSLEQTLGTQGPISAAPTARSRTIRTAKPQLESQRNGDCRIRHREYIQDITAGTGSPSVFSVQTLPVNPGQQSTFPWLSQLAQRFESYRFDSLKFCFETESPSTTPGSLILGVDYDASDPAPVSKQQLMAYRSSVRSAPWEYCCHTSLSEDLHKQKSYFVRPAGVPVSADVKLYDVGNLQVASQGATSAATLGELYVEYDVLLMTPSFDALSDNSGSMTSAATTVAAPFLNAVALGPITLAAQALFPTFVNITGLIPGNEYLFTYSTDSAATINLASTPAAKHNYAGGASTGPTSAVLTFIAPLNTTVSNVQVTLGAPATNVLVTVAAIPVSAF